MKIDKADPQQLISQPNETNKKKDPQSQENVKQQKNSKQQATQMRAGDWVCLVCNNLNFSFRNECNRCQLQSKKQNYIQNLIMMQQQNNLLQYQQQLWYQNYYQGNNRKPLQELTNQLQQQRQQFSSNLKLGFQSNYVVNEQSKKLYEQIKNAEIYDGFENKVLITPQKQQLSKTQTSTKVKIEEIPYKTPQKIPQLHSFLKTILFKNQHQTLQSQIKFSSEKSLFNELTEKKENQLKKNKSFVEFDEQSEQKENPVFNLFDEKYLPFNLEKYFKGSGQNLEEQQENQDQQTEESYDNSKEIEESIEKLLEEEIFPENSIVREQAPEKLEKPEKIKINQILFNKENQFKESNQQQYPTKKSNIRMQGKQKKKQNEIKKNDWICPKCNNLNYSFRVCCNRCHQIMRPDAKA